MRTNARKWSPTLVLLALMGFASSSGTAEPPPAAAAHRPPLKQRLQGGEICRGAFLGLLVGGPAAQFLAGQGFDYFILDLEHYTFDETTVREMIIGARAAGIAPILRVGAPTQ